MVRVRGARRPIPNALGTSNNRRPACPAPNPERARRSHKVEDAGVSFAGIAGLRMARSVCMAGRTC
jgi:hypothetical protein